MWPGQCSIVNGNPGHSQSQGSQSQGWWSKETGQQK